jgi:hypothetical protein
MKSNNFNKIKFYVCHGVVLPFFLMGLYVFIVRDHLYGGALFVALFWGMKIYSDYKELVVNGNRNSPELDSRSLQQRGHISGSDNEPDIKPPAPCKKVSFEVRYHYVQPDGSTKAMGPAVFHTMDAVEKFIDSYLWDDKNPKNNPAFATVYNSENETTINVDFPDEG